MKLESFKDTKKREQNKDKEIVFGKENKVLDLEDCKEMLTEKGFLYSGHGTNGEYDVVSSIFNIGLRTSHESLYYTSINLSLGGEEGWVEFKQNLNNWQHKNTKNIIILKLPLKYLNTYGDEAYEKYNAFYVQKEFDGRIQNFVDSKFIVGCYNANTKKFEINPNFEAELTVESKKDLENKLLIAKNLTKERLERLSDNDSFSEKYTSYIDTSKIDDISDEEW